MHILLTDVLVCPRCGPAFGLILLADRIEDRRVQTGRLGCPNCREQCEIEAGVVDMTAGAEVADGPPPEATLSVVPDAGVRMAALLGIPQGPAYVLLAGSRRPTRWR